MCMPMEKDKVQHTAYDNAFRTVEAECDDALVMFINYMFLEDYDNTAEVERLRNEHFIENEGRKNEKRITDSHFRISCHGEAKEYQIESESRGYSGSLMVRMFQYAVQTAIDGSDYGHESIILSFPHSGLLVLRDKGTPPERVLFEIRTPGGVVSYDAPVICVTDYTVEELFERKLYLLLPFFAFIYEDRMDVYEENAKERKKFFDIYCDIIKNLQQIKHYMLN